MGIFGQPPEPKIQTLDHNSSQGESMCTGNEVFWEPIESIAVCPRQMWGENSWELAT